MTARGYEQRHCNQCAGVALGAPSVAAFSGNMAAIADAIDVTTVGPT
jgi:hypothetical protein